MKFHCLLSGYYLIRFQTTDKELRPFNQTAIKMEDTRFFMSKIVFIS